ncbi:MAG: hypothetical protein ACRD5R_18115 [Candidatus Acidiferrales bacterium]
MRPLLEFTSNLVILKEGKTMLRVKIPAYVRFLLFGMFLLPVMSSGLTLQARGLQTQNSAAAGATVVVRMIDAVDSSKDPAGKQYRASVTKVADAGNGVTIPQGSAAAVTLAQSSNGSGWMAQLASVVINGQPVAVASGPASVTAGAQTAASSAVSAVSSMLGGFGHHVSAPSSVTAIATGQRVVLPPGTTLTFVLGPPPAANSASPAASAAQPLTASAAPAPMGGGMSAAGASNPAVTNQAVSAGALAASIEETLLGPSKPAGAAVVSPDGGHYAAPAMRGSREVVVIDGADGPEVDRDTWGGHAMDFVFSSDGKHSAYVAQIGDDLVEVRDGKVAFTITSITPLPNHDPTGTVPMIDQMHIHNPGYYQVGGAGNPLGGGGHQCLISPSGAHVAVVAHMGNPSESGGFYMFLDGVKSPAYNFIDVGQVAFVAEKLIYIAQSNDHKWHVVVNDKPGPAYDGVKNLLLNDDSSHYAFIGAAGGSGWGVGVDGVLGAPRGDIRNMVIASNGRVAYTTAGRVNGATGAQVGSSGLYVDDHELGPVTMPFAVVDSSGRGSDVQPYVLFSPDGKRFAYTRQVPGGFAVVVDGKVGRPYDGIGVFQFSPDSKHYFYVGNRNSAFLVYDGQEMPGEDSNGVSNFVFSQTGGRLAYLAKSAQAGTRMVVDGKASLPFKGGLVAHSMTFSQDGKHYAYATTVGYPPSQIVRDGVNAASVPSLISFTTRTGPPHIDFPPLLFSGDGTRLAWGWPKPDGVSKDVISIDGQEIIHGYSTYEFPEFSPDSKHFATMIWNANKYSLAVDGKVGPSYDDFLEVNRNVARFLDSHTFRFLGVKNGSVYRVTVNLGG